LVFVWFVKSADFGGHLDIVEHLFSKNFELRKVDKSSQISPPKIRL